MMEVKTLSVIIPAYNEARRLPPTLEALMDWYENQKLRGEPVIGASGGKISWHLSEVLVVDDGSKDDTMAVAVSFLTRWRELKVTSLRQNQGKGAALREGFLRAQGDWVLLADADMSTPWTEIEKLICQAEQQNATLAMGSRGLPQSQIRVRQSWMREHLGKTFNLILRTLTGVPFKDTQCGFKLLRNTPEVRQIFENLQIQRFAYDVEIILNLLSLGLKVVEVPVIWEHKDESRVHPIKDGFDMLYSVLRLRLAMLLRVKRQ